MLFFFVFSLKYACVIPILIVLGQIVIIMNCMPNLEVFTVISEFLVMRYNLVLDVNQIPIKKHSILRCYSLLLKEIWHEWFYVCERLGSFIKVTGYGLGNQDLMPAGTYLFISNV